MRLDEFGQFPSEEGLSQLEQVRWLTLGFDLLFVEVEPEEPEEVRPYYLTLAIIHSGPKYSVQLVRASQAYSLQVELKK